MVCDKISYQNIKMAQDAIIQLSKRKKKQSFKYYTCNDCGKIHVTTIRIRPTPIPDVPSIEEATRVFKEKRNDKISQQIHKKGKPGTNKKIETTYRPFERFFQNFHKQE